MSLVLEIEFLTGVYRGTRNPSSEKPDWPPQVDRVFSALVCAWAVRGENGDERRALEWLEQQPTPTIHASECTRRVTPACYVPPNDFKLPTGRLDNLKWYRDYLSQGIPPPKQGGYKRQWERALSIHPSRRQRKERQFPVACPEDPTVSIVWPSEPDPGMAEALDSIARDVGYIGHSASLVRCQFLQSDSTELDHAGSPARRRVYPGRLAELESAHHLNPVRPKIQPGASVSEETRRVEDESSRPWLILELIEGVAPDLRASALVCRALRRALMSGYRRTGLADAIPEIVSGHDARRKPTRCPHLAVVPLAFAGYEYSDGHLLGFALIPPIGTELRDIPGFVEAFNAVAPYDLERERRVLKLEGRPLNNPLSLAPAGATPIRSLSREPYIKPGHVWASVTPIVLDRHLKRNCRNEVREMIAQACENAGLPRPDPERIQTGRHSAVEGAPPARPSAGEPPWTAWKVPESLATRSLVHAVIDFGGETAGPVLLGAGRFTGLGLCRRLEG